MIWYQTMPLPRARASRNSPPSARFERHRGIGADRRGARPATRLRRARTTRARRFCTEAATGHSSATSTIVRLRGGLASGHVRAPMIGGKIDRGVGQSGGARREPARLQRAQRRGVEVVEAKPALASGDDRPARSDHAEMLRSPPKRDIGMFSHSCEVVLAPVASRRSAPAASDRRAPADVRNGLGIGWTENM